MTLLRQSMPKEQRDDEVGKSKSELLSHSYTTKVDARGRVVVRKELRTAIGLPLGGRVEWEVRGTEAIFRAVKVEGTDA